MMQLVVLGKPYVSQIILYNTVATCHYGNKGNLDTGKFGY